MQGGGRGVCVPAGGQAQRPYPESTGDRGGGRLKDGAEISLCVSEAAKSPCSYLGLWAHRICGGWGSPDVGSVWPLSPPPAARPEAGHFLPLLSLWLAGGAETSWAGDEGNERGASALSRERLRAS